MDIGWGFSRLEDFHALVMLLGEMWSAAKVATSTVKWIGWQGKVWRVMIRVVILRHVLARLKGTSVRRSWRLLIGLISRGRRTNSMGW